MQMPDAVVLRRKADLVPYANPFAMATSAIVAHMASPSLASLNDRQHA